MIKAKVKSKFSICWISYERNFSHAAKRKAIHTLESGKKKSLPRDVFLKWMYIKLAIC